MSREKEAGAEHQQTYRSNHSVPVSSKLWRLHVAIEKVNSLQRDLELTKAPHQTYLLPAQCYAESELMKQRFRTAMRRLKP